MDEADYIRLHITPLTPNLLTILFPPSVHAKARNISFHAIQTFPENSYGYLDLPRSEAERMKKKLQGCIIQGHKVRIETARSRRQPVINSEPSSVQVPQPERKKRGRDELPGVDIGDRHVKRGWTTPAHELKKNNTISSIPKTTVRSKYTNGPECLFKTTLPINHTYHEQPAGRIPHKKSRGCKEMVIHEFARTTKYATFLRGQDSRSSLNTVTEYVQGKGWLDEQGNIIEEVKPSKRRLGGVSDVCRKQKSKPSSVSGGMVDEIRSRESYNSSSDENYYESSHVGSLERGLDEMEIDAEISMTEVMDDVLEIKPSALSLTVTPSSDDLAQSSSSSSSSNSSSDNLAQPSSSSSSSSSTSSSTESSDGEASLDAEDVLNENMQLRNRNSLSPAISSSLSPSSASSTSSESINGEDDEDDDNDKDNYDDNNELNDEEENRAGDEELLYLENKSLSDDSIDIETSPKSQLSIRVPSTCHDRLKVSHPLELLYKKEITSQKPDEITHCTQTEFTFFPVDGEEQDDDHLPSQVPSQGSVASPLTPFTRKDIERRTVRSPAPTPDTAHPYKHFDWSIGHRENTREEKEGDQEGRLLIPVATNINHVTSQAEQVSESNREPSEFENWFWKNQGNINRSWKQRRKTVFKEHRQRESRMKIP